MRNIQFFVENTFHIIVVNLHYILKHTSSCNSRTIFVVIIIITIHEYLLNCFEKWRNKIIHLKKLCITNTDIS